MQETQLRSAPLFPPFSLTTSHTESSFSIVANKAKSLIELFRSIYASL
jgi:hypothetical protein